MYSGNEKLPKEYQCLVCEALEVRLCLELGRHPVSSHFTNAPDITIPVYDLSLGICQVCGMVQLIKPWSHKVLISPFDWFTYREPEGHLDDVVGKICSLVEVNSFTRVLGISVKDQSTIDRFKKIGIETTSTINLKQVFGRSAKNAGIESIQHYLTPEFASHWSQKNGKWDVVIARHIIEHAERPAGFLSALSNLVSDNGYLVLEVPDCDPNLTRQDITMVWEEHTLYFTPGTFRETLERFGFEEVIFENYPMTFENCMVLVGKKTGSQINKENNVDRAHKRNLKKKITIFDDYAKQYSFWGDLYRSYLEKQVRKGKRLAIYGAGHLSCAFIHYYRIKHLISFVVDDTVEKQGLYLPGTGLPIVSSHHLATKNIDLCLLGLSPDIEDKVIANNKPFIEQGGKFKSIFVSSPRSLRADL